MMEEIFLQEHYLIDYKVLFLIILMTFLLNFDTIQFNKYCNLKLTRANRIIKILNKSSLYSFFTTIFLCQKF